MSLLNSKINSIVAEIGDVSSQVTALEASVASDLSDKQNILTVNGNDSTTYKLIDSNNQVRDLKAGTNASITLAGNDLTINGPSLTG
jgi:hypothetical protein